MLNLLTEPLIRYKTDSGGVVNTTLPQVYAALVADDVASFPALRPHQRHAWHAFLVQLGAMALHRAGKDGSDLPTDAGEWAAMIRGLTPDWPEDEPWQLVVDDITKPAFMQPPASSPEQWQDYKTKSFTPDELDPLDTARNHDLKMSVVPASDFESWIYALITEQTTDAHMANNPSISRISGRGSRLAFGLTSSTRTGRHVCRDISALLSQWDLLGEDCETKNDGYTLLWLVPWDGKKPLSLATLHPLYIEVCRRRRLATTMDGKYLFANRAAGTKKRIAGAEHLKGRTGDPWIPTNLKREKILTLPSKTGFTYKQVTAFLTSGDWKLPLLCHPTRDETAASHPMYLVARGISQGEEKKKTGGYYERIIPLRPRVATVFGRPSATKELGDIARERVGQVGKVQGFLRDAVATFIAQGSDIYDKDFGSDKRRRIGNGATPWSNELDEIVDDRFFDDLQEEFEETDEILRRQIRDSWLLNDRDQRGIINHARALLYDAIYSLPCPAIHYYRSRVSAVGLFERQICGNKGFPDLFRNFDQEDPK